MQINLGRKPLVPIKNTPRIIRGVFLIGDISDLFLSWNARWYMPE